MSVSKNKFYRHQSHQQSEREEVRHIPIQDFHQSKTAVFCPYFINGNAVRYHIIKQGIFDIAVMQGLVGQLTIQATFQFIL